MNEAQIEKAEQWQRKHSDHVKRLLSGCLSGYGTYEPTGSDASSPELWKPAHWRWFFTREMEG